MFSIAFNLQFSVTEQTALQPTPHNPKFGPMHRQASKKPIPYPVGSMDLRIPSPILRLRQRNDKERLGIVPTSYRNQKGQVSLRDNHERATEHLAEQPLKAPRHFNHEDATEHFLSSGALEIQRLARQVAGDAHMTDRDSLMVLQAEDGKKPVSVEAKVTPHRAKTKATRQSAKVRLAGVRSEEDVECLMSTSLYVDWRSGIREAEAAEIRDQAREKASALDWGSLTALQATQPVEHDTEEEKSSLQSAGSKAPEHKTEDDTDRPTAASLCIDLYSSLQKAAAPSTPSEQDFWPKKRKDRYAQVTAAKAMPSPETVRAPLLIENPFVAQSPPPGYESLGRSLLEGEGRWKAEELLGLFEELKMQDRVEAVAGSEEFGMEGGKAAETLRVDESKPAGERTTDEMRDASRRMRACLARLAAERKQRRQKSEWAEWTATSSYYKEQMDEEAGLTRTSTPTATVAEEAEKWKREAERIMRGIGETVRLPLPPSLTLESGHGDWELV